MLSKVIVITGASHGIGAALARQLAARGDHLMLAARSAEELGQVASACGRDAFPFTTDVMRRQDVNLLRDEALRVFGHVDVWINNAGRGIIRNVLDLTDADIDEMIAINVKSALYGMQAIVPHFKERGAGHLINVSSMLSRIPFATNRSAYNAAKGALNGLTASLRMDLRAQYPDVRVSLVMPGAVSTAFAANSLHAPAESASLPSVTAQTPEAAAAAMVDLIDNPRAEICTNPDVQLGLLRRYFDDVDAFEEALRR